MVVNEGDNMQFNDEFEFETKDGNVYDVEVTGKLTSEGTTVEEVQIFDSLGNLLDDEHDDYAEVHVEAMSREYEPEVHSSDFDHYETNMPESFKDKKDLVH